MILLALAAVAAQPAESPRRFLDRVYASYRKPNFSPFRQPGRYFAPRLVAAIAEDSRLAHGEVGYLDGDPLCQCQDTAGLHAKILQVRALGAKRANAEVALNYPDNTPTRIRLSLTMTKSGWRIADVSANGEPSLIRALDQSNARQRRR
jgi:hypothetical protein